MWLGKCLCNTYLMVDLEGAPTSRATIEHIVPQAHGGTEALENLGLACARCNQGKGSRHDHRYNNKDVRAQELVQRLLARRHERWREPEL